MDTKTKQKQVMNRKLLFLTIILFSLTVNAQVGVKTENPQGVFHIDGQGNTSGSTNISDDIVVTATGNVGVGTNAPATKVDIRTSTAGNGFRLQDGTQENGMVLTSDASGNGKWAAPGFSEFTRVDPISLNQAIPIEDHSDYTVVMLTNTDGTPYSIELPSHGTYSLTLGARVAFSNLAANSVIGSAVLQLLPDNDIGLWDAVSPRFEGSYEIYGLQAQIEYTDYRFYLSENITTTETTGKRVYFALCVRGENLPNPLRVIFTLGSGGEGCPQCSGGSYVRIN